MQDPREIARQRRIAELSALRSSSSTAAATLPVIVSATANLTAQLRDLVLCNTSGGGFTVTLPSPGTAGESVGVKLVAGPGALTVSGTMFTNQSASTLTITDVGTSVTFVSDGSTWQVT